MLVRDGRAIELEAHLARLAASVAALYGEEPPELDLGAARGLLLARLRVTVAPDTDHGLVAAVRTAPVDASHVFPTTAVVLRPLVVAGGLGPHKWADRRLVEGAEDSDALPLLVDADGTVLEASRANVFVVEGGTIVTPPADGRILPGVTRARVLGLVAVREEAVAIDRLLAADEVFLTGSVRGVEPVAAYEGPVTREVAGVLRRHWEGEP